MHLLNKAFFNAESIKLPEEAHPIIMLPILKLAAPMSKARQKSSPGSKGSKQGRTLDPWSPPAAPSAPAEPGVDFPRLRKSIRPPVAWQNPRFGGQRLDDRFEALDQSRPLFLVVGVIVGLYLADAVYEQGVTGDEERADQKTRAAGRVTGSMINLDANRANLNRARGEFDFGLSALGNIKARGLPQESHTP